jgi:hypothetical protein
MVYTYQIVTKPLTTRNLPDEVCPVCSRKGGVQLTLYMQYIRAFLPIYGMGRRTGVRCSLCTHEIKNPNASILAKGNYSPAIAAAIKDIRATHKRTTWQLVYPWSFWFVVLLLGGVAVVYGKVRKGQLANVKEMLMHPQPGDIYRATWHPDDPSTASKCALVKLTRIEGDTLFVVASKTSIPVSYNKKDWDAFSTADDAFDPQEYKLKYSSYKKDLDFFMYKPDNVGAIQTVYVGAPMSKGESNVDFDVVERKKSK